MIYDNIIKQLKETNLNGYSCIMFEEFELMMTKTCHKVVQQMNNYS